jgi:catechol 2,3-dioxygenase-like lactoylglutathione lyase family enzyme
VTVRRVVPNFVADDPRASRTFYEDVLGLETAMDLGWIVTYVSPANETAQVNVFEAGDGAADAPAASVEVDDVDATHARAIAAGLEIVRPLRDEPWGVRRFFVRDPNGVVLNVMSHSSGGTAAHGAA